MKRQLFQEITPNNRPDFHMLYYACWRNLRHLEHRIRMNHGKLPLKDKIILDHLYYKLTQMVGVYKSNKPIPRKMKVEK